MVEFNVRAIRLTRFRRNPLDDIPEIFITSSKSRQGKRPYKTAAMLTNS